jgi:hypothetical protein
MTSLKVVLWIAAIGCLTAVPFIFSPWSTVESIACYFGINSLPNAPIAVYFFKVAFGVFGLIGVFFIVLALNPSKYGSMLYLAAFGLILFGILALVLGFSIGLQPIIYLGDGLSGLVLGIAILFFSSKSKQARST